MNSALLLVGVPFIALAVAALAAVTLWPALNGPVGALAHHFEAAHGLAPTEPVHRAVHRFIARTRGFARVGAVAGALTAAIIGPAWYGTVSAGMAASPLADVVTMGLAGWLAGLLLAAGHWRRRPAGTGPRSVRLAPREPSRYRPAGAVSAARVLGAASVLLAGARP